jgi:hypothetical protein
MAVSTLFFLQAPYPALQTLTVLPSPRFSDTMALTDAVMVKRAMDGTRYTYVKTKGGRKKLKWEFLVTRNKGLELRAFIQSYFASQIYVTDHLGRSWIGHFTSNPFEFDTPERGAPPRQGWPVGEVQAISIEFEGIQQAVGTLTPVLPPAPPVPPPLPTFNIGSLGNLQYRRGATVAIPWSATNVIAGSKVSLCYTPAAVWSGWSTSPLYWIEINQIAAVNGNNTYNWNTTGVVPGIFYIGGYLFQNGSPTYAISKPSLVEITY